MFEVRVQGFWETLGETLQKTLVEMACAEDLTPTDKVLLYGILRNAAADLGGRFNDSYSGRGMLGRTCVGVCCDDVAKFGFALAKACYKAEQDPDEIQELLGEGLQDTLGKQMIIYWPRFLTHEERHGGPPAIEEEESEEIW